MSRFADATATKTVDLGPCECPGTPHESDWAKVRTEASAEEAERFVDTEKLTPEGAAEAVASFIPEWNLLGPNGEPWPPSTDSVRALKMATVKIIAKAVAETINESVTLPNASAAPSRGLSRGSGSRTPAKTRKPTT